MVAAVGESGQRLVLQGISWDAYEKILHALSGRVGVGTSDLLLVPTPRVGTHGVDALRHESAWERVICFSFASPQ